MKFTSFSSLPTSTKRLMGLGAVLALAVALPLFIWAIINQKFLINQNAQTTSGIGQKTVKVMVIDFDPTLTTQGNQKLSTFENWANAQDLEASYSSELKTLSNNYANFQIVDRVDVPTFPQKNDGFIYTESAYLACLANHSTCHNPDLVDYLKILQDYQVCDKVNSGEIDELWLWGGPWFGYWEAVVTGPDAFNTNAPPILGSTCNKNLHIMGFNYERGLSEMLEDFGHRFEGTMTHVFTENNISLWTNYTNHSACGTVHIPPNGTNDYDWSNPAQVQSSCEDWLNYPILTLVTQTFGCERWGCTGLGWKEYWLNHIPKADSFTNSTWNNWWKYVLDYDAALSSTPSPSPTASPTESPTITPMPTFSPTPTATPTDTPTPTGTPNSCGGTCGSIYNCNMNLFCYQGFCRNPDCPNDLTCGCVVTPTPKPINKSTAKPTPTSQIVYLSPVPLATSSATPLATLTPMPTAIAQAQKHTDFSYLLWISGGTFATAVILMIFAL